MLMLFYNNNNNNNHAETSSTTGWIGRSGFTCCVLSISAACADVALSCFRSTARQEAAALAGHALFVPSFVDKLIKKILAGDTDAVDLTGTGRALLLANSSAMLPPTAIKAQFYLFDFSSSSAWWKSSDVPNNPATIYTQTADRYAQSQHQRAFALVVIQGLPPALSSPTPVAGGLSRAPAPHTVGTYCALPLWLPLLLSLLPAAPPFAAGSALH
jgi:hypothetical protein